MVSVTPGGMEFAVYIGPLVQALRHVSGFEQAYEGEGSRSMSPADPAKEEFVTKRRPPILLQCPSNAPEFGTSYRANIGPGEISHSHSLKRLRDLGIDSPGPFAHFLKLHSSKVTRGLSHTVGVSETVPGVSRYKVYNTDFSWEEFPPRLPDRAQRWDERCLEASRSESPARYLGIQGPPMSGRNFELFYSHRKPPNSSFPLCYAHKPRLGRVATGDIGITATSHHAGGVNLCNLDGSVHFYSSSTDENLWKEISMIQPSPLSPQTPDPITYPDNESRFRLIRMQSSD